MIHTLVLSEELFLSLDTAVTVGILALPTEVAAPAAMVCARAVAAAGPAPVGELVEPAALVWSPAGRRRPGRAGRALIGARGGGNGCRRVRGRRSRGARIRRGGCFGECRGRRVL